MDQMDAYMREGMGEEEALDKAIMEMGDPVEVGVEFDRIHRPQMSWSMVLAVGILGILSVVYSTGCRQSEMKWFCHTSSCFLLLLDFY